VLRVGLSEPGEKDLAHVRSAVAVSILRVQEVRSARHEYAPAPGHHASWKEQPIEEDRGLVEASVAVHVREANDPAPSSTLVVEAKGIVPHLDDPEPSIRSPVEGDRASNQGFRRDQLDLETWPRTQRAE
jgi:hypothetical protein